MRFVLALLIGVCLASSSQAALLHGYGGQDFGSPDAGGAWISGIGFVSASRVAVVAEEDTPFVIWGPGGSGVELGDATWVDGGGGAVVYGVIPAGDSYEVNFGSSFSTIVGGGSGDEFGVFASGGGDAYESGEGVFSPGINGDFDIDSATDRWDVAGFNGAASGVDIEPLQVPEPGSGALGVAAILAALGLNDRLTAGLLAIGASILVVVGAFFGYCGIRHVMRWGRHVAG